MEYRLNLNKRAIERFYFWGNVAMLVEALGLLLWVIAVFFLFKKAFIEFFIGSVVALCYYFCLLFLVLLNSHPHENFGIFRL